MLQQMLLNPGTAALLHSQVLSLACPAMMALKPSLLKFSSTKPEGLLGKALGPPGVQQQFAKGFSTGTAAAATQASSAAEKTATPAVSGNNSTTTTTITASTDYEPEYVVPHPGMSKVPTGTSIKQLSVPADVAAVMRHPVYPGDYLESIEPKHLEPKELHQKLAFRTIQAIRSSFDLATGYSPHNMTPSKWLRRIIFLETVAGVPGMVGGMLRHLRSLRRMQRDNGWINTLLEEAENERMHLLTFMEMRNPGWFFRSSVIIAQGVMFNLMFAAYLVSPKFCHALVGYLEEEAVKTYTHALKDIDAGKLWPDTPAPAIARSYWRLPETATMRDLILVVRADEACHSHVNHTFARLQQDETNPFTKDSHMVP